MRGKLRVFWGSYPLACGLPAIVPCYETLMHHPQLGIPAWIKLTETLDSFGSLSRHRQGLRPMHFMIFGYDLFHDVMDIMMSRKGYKATTNNFQKSCSKQCTKIESQESLGNSFGTTSAPRGLQDKSRNEKPGSLAAARVPEGS